MNSGPISSLISMPGSGIGAGTRVKQCLPLVGGSALLYSG
jgi:hypothetical protein